MQLGAEMAVLERGVERAVARVGEHGRDRHAGKIVARNLPASARALKREQTFARRHQHPFGHDLLLAHQLIRKPEATFRDAILLIEPASRTIWNSRRSVAP